MSPGEESALLDRLLRKEGPAFREAIALCGPAMLRAARAILKNDASAQEVVQDAWVSVLTALPRFERRSSFRTWCVSIAMNKARTRFDKEAREVSGQADEDDVTYHDTSFDGAGFVVGRPEWTRHTLERLSDAEQVAVVHATIAEMPPLQAAVLTLHDLEEMSAAEICNVLAIRPSNQRVLLHRARLRVRQAWLAKLEKREDRR